MIHNSRLDTLISSKNQGFVTTTNMLHDQIEDDRVVLDLDDRKRRRSVVEQLDHKDIEMGHKQSYHIKELSFLERI